MDEKILQVNDLKTYLHTSGGIVKAVDDISFEIKKAETFGIVGESGSGKTMTALSILNILPYGGRIAGGNIMFKGLDLAASDERTLRMIRGRAISIVFQEPASSLNPVFTIGEQMVEALMAHQDTMDRKKAAAMSLEYLEKVHIQDPRKAFSDYPHQLSGGAKQRIMIAMALLNGPELLILDEPTTALDVTIQAQILDLLEEIISRENLSILFISHDFGIIGRMCKRVAVMHNGKIVETNTTEAIFARPKNEYTISILASVKALL